MGGKNKSTIASPRKLTPTANECPTSLTMSGKTSAEIAKGDVPAVGEYAIMYRIPKTATRGTRATWTPAAFSLKENASINIVTNIGKNPRRRRVARPTTSSNQKAGAPKLLIVLVSVADRF